MQILYDYREVLSSGSGNIPRSDLAPMKIELTDYTPFYCSPRRFRKEIEQAVDKEIDRLLLHDIISPSKSPYSSPICPVKRKGSDAIRLTLDYRFLNSRTVPDRFPLPNLTDSVYSLHGAKWFSTLDLTKGYHQIEMSEESRKYTAFVTPRGLFHWNRVPFGLCGAPAAFQRQVNIILRELLREGIINLLDDCLPFSKTFEEHEIIVRKLFQTLKDHKMTINITKCRFFQEEVNFLGHKITRDGLRKQDKFVAGLDNLRRPDTVKELMSFVGMITFNRKFIPKFAEICRPLYDWFNKPVNTKLTWDEEMIYAYDRLIADMREDVLLSYPDMSEGSPPLHLFCDASNVAMGCILGQEIDEDFRVIANDSKVFSAAQRNYSTIQRELAAMRWAVQSFRHLLYGKKFIIHVDHQPLVYLNRMKLINARLARTLTDLSEFVFEIVYTPGTVNVAADAFSRLVYKVEQDSNYEQGALPPELKVLLTPGGGDSLFTSLVVGLNRLPETIELLDPHNLRVLLINELLEFYKEYKIELNKEGKRKLRTMKHKGILPCMETLLACSKLFKIRCLVHTGNMYPIIYAIEDHLNYDSAHTIHLQLLDGCHFNPVFEKDPNDSYFPPHDAQIAERANIEEFPIDCVKENFNHMLQNNDKSWHYNTSNIISMLGINLPLEFNFNSFLEKCKTTDKQNLHEEEGIDISILYNNVSKTCNFSELEKEINSAVTNHDTTATNLNEDIIINNDKGTTLTIKDNCEKDKLNVALLNCKVNRKHSFCSIEVESENASNVLFRCQHQVAQNMISEAIIENTRVCVLWDSGAARNIVSLPLIQHLKKTKNIVPSEFTVYGIAGRSSKHGAITLQIKFMNNEIDLCMDTKFEVLPGHMTPYCILLGNPFLCRNGIDLHVSENKIKLKNKHFIKCLPMDANHSESTVSLLFDSIIEDVNIAELQDIDPKLRRLKNWVERNIADPRWTNDLNIFKKHFPKFNIKDGILLCQLSENNPVIVSYGMMISLISKYHIKMGHFGKYHILKLLRPVVYHPRFNKLVLDITSSCPHCQFKKTQAQQITPPIAKIVPQNPYDLLAMDITLLPKTRSQYIGCLTVIDLKSKFLWAVPLKDKKSCTVAKILENYIIPTWIKTAKRIMSDNGGEFLAEPVKNVLARHGIEHITVAPRSPFSNGAIERVHKTLQSIFKLTMPENEKNNWDAYLTCALRSYNESPHSELGQSPSDFLLKQCHVYDRLPVIEGNQTHLWSAGSPHFVRFQVGNEVLKKIHDVGNLVTNKLKNKFEGPFKIEKVNENGMSYIVIDPRYPDRKYRCHHKHLRLFRKVPKYLKKHPAYREHFNIIELPEYINDCNMKIVEKDDDVLSMSSNVSKMEVLNIYPPPISEYVDQLMESYKLHLLYPLQFDDPFENHNRQGEVTPDQVPDMSSRSNTIGDRLINDVTYLVDSLSESSSSEVRDIESFRAQDEMLWDNSDLFVSEFANFELNNLSNITYSVTRHQQVQTEFSSENLSTSSSPSEYSTHVQHKDTTEIAIQTNISYANLNKLEKKRIDNKNDCLLIQSPIMRNASIFEVGEEEITQITINNIIDKQSIEKHNCSSLKLSQKYEGPITRSQALKVKKSKCEKN